MIPIYLKISGFLSYQEPAELDFDGFDLACISGANGAGKSSLLDAITWVLFGQARRRDNSIINSHCKNAEVTLDYTYEGNTYRVQRSKTNRKTAMLDFFVQDEDGKWRTLSERTLRDTETRITQSLRMDYETFTNASFFLQGKADQFAQQRPGDRKRILSSILGLETWETYRESTVQRRRKIESEINTLDNRLEEINSELEQKNARRSHLKNLENELDTFAALRKAKEKSLEQLRKLAASLEEQERLVHMLHEQAKTAQNRREEREKILSARYEEERLYQEQLETADDIDSAYNQWQKLRVDLEKWESIASNFREFDTQRAQPMMVIETERSRLGQELITLEDEARKVKTLEEQIPVLKTGLEQANEALKETLQQFAQREILEVERTEIQETSSDAAAENKRLKQEMQELKQRIDQLQAAIGAACPLCGQPLNETDRARLIEDLEIEGKHLGDQFRSNQEFYQNAENRFREVENALLEYKKFDPIHRQQQRQFDQVESQLAQINSIVLAWETNQLPHLQTLIKQMEQEDFAPEARQQLIEIDARLKEIGYDSAKHDAVKQAEQKMRTSEEQKRQMDAAKAALDPLKREIGELEKGLQEDRSEIERQEHAYQEAESKFRMDSENIPDIQQAERELFDLQEQENRIRMEVGGAMQAVEVLKTLQKKGKEFEQQREQLSQRIAQLKIIERAFSKDGIPALLIEQALPEIETQANDILDRLTNGSMSVRFETQQEYKDKKREDKKETLDILISDAAGMRDYALFSGGEAFRVNFAIRLALSRVLAQRAGARLQTLVIDEGFGSQDSEGRQRLIEAINMVRSDFEKVLVITHLEELKDAFPARIEVTKTNSGSQLQVIT